MLYGVEVFYILLVIAVLVAMWWFAYHMEPHWASADGSKFICNAQEMLGQQTVGRRQETRVAIMPDGALHVTQKHLLRRKTSLWTLVGKAPEPPKKLQIYLARQHRDGAQLPAELALRIPTKSRCIGPLDAALAASLEQLRQARAQLKASRPAPGTAARAEPPDRG